MKIKFNSLLSINNFNKEVIRIKRQKENREFYAPYIEERKKRIANDERMKCQYTFIPKL